MRQFSLLIVSLALLGIIQCGSFQSRGDFSTAKEAIRNGDKEVPQKIYQNLSEIPADLKKEAIETIAVSQDPSSTRILENMATRPEISTPEDKSALLSALAKKNDPKSTPAIITLASDPAVINEDAIRYFTINKTTEAIPILDRTTRNTKLAESAYDSLLSTKSKQAEAMILASASDPKHPARIGAIKRLPLLSNTNASSSLLVGILKNKDGETPLVYQTALDTIAQIPYNDTSYGALLESYDKAKDGTEKKEILSTLAIIRGIPIDEMEQEMKLSIAKTQGNLTIADASKSVEGRKIDDGADLVELKRQPSTEKKANQKESNDPKSKTEKSKKDTKTASTKKTSTKDSTKKDSTKVIATKDSKNKDKSNEVVKEASYTVPKGEKIPKFKQSYPAVVGGVLSDLFGDEAAGTVRINMHNALLAYSKSNTTAGTFVIDAYEKAYGVDEERARAFLGNGLNQNGGVGVILRSIIRQYERKPMQVYAASRVFGIDRWQAEALLEKASKNKL